MRLLADENFPRSLVLALRNQTHDVVWARTDCAGWADAALLEFAESTGRIVLTLDKDFWQIAVPRRIPLKRSGVVLFRVHPATAEKLASLLQAWVVADREWVGHVSVVTTGGIQMVTAG